MLSIQSTPEHITACKSKALANGILLGNGYGSWSKYDSSGNMIEIGVSQVSNLYEEFLSMVNGL